MNPPVGLALLILLLAGCAGVAAEPTGSAQAATVVEKEEIVDAQHGAQSWAAAAAGEQLKIKDKLRTGEFSRAAVRLTDLSMLRVDELTTIEISAAPSTGKTNLGVQQGATYFFSREKGEEMQVHTPAANGALRGTEFVVRVAANGKTTFTMLDGQVDFGNARGHILLHTGEQGEAEVGGVPHKTAVIDAKNIIQWCLYYPGVLDPDSLGLTPAESGALAGSLAAYRSGDLLRALAKHPHNAGSAAARTYYASVMLAVGQVSAAKTELAAVPESNPNRRALEQVIAAVRLDPWTEKADPQTAAQWLARSYYEQAQGNLEAALKSARKATELAPRFGYAWERVAELEFSFGRTSKALEALGAALKLTPRNAQAHALQGFLLSAQNEIRPARDSFDAAIAIDGALGNAWLGRGLTSIRQGHAEAGRDDLQTAATLEPNRSLLRSYLGKAFSQQGFPQKAVTELERAQRLDPHDPTPWLYSAIEAKQENRYNDAIHDLEKSIDLNDYRRVYRSQFLLDQDKSVRSANLAAIYRNDGLIEQSVREAVVAVNNDYANASTHLFLSNSYDALRDPNRVQLRYETAWFNELLLSNLLSPVGGGPLSQFVSQQEYSKLFEGDGLGISSSTDYYSNGELHEVASQFGTSGNLSYALDAEYLYERGYRTNDTDSLFESYATFKLQVDPKDTLFLKLNYQEQRTGDIFNTFDPRASALTLADRTHNFHDAQEPGLILFGLHHDWAPGAHTLLLFGRLADDISQTEQQSSQAIVSRDLSSVIPAGSALNIPTFGFNFNQRAADLRPFTGQGTVTAFNSLPFNLAYGSRFEVYQGEFQQIVETGPMTFIGGLRYQKGRFTTSDTLAGAGPSFAVPSIAALFNSPSARDQDTVDFQRINLYAYDIWRITPWLSITGGVTWDKLTYPTNFRSPPVSDQASNLDKVSPKAGFIFQPTRTLTLRGAYAEAISGASFDESIRLEPTQVAGFNQAYRTIISEDLIGSVAGASYKTYGLSLEQKLPTGTYWGIEYDLLKQTLDRSTGVFDFLADPRDFSVAAALPSSLRENIAYREQDLTANFNQIVGRDWSFGARFQFTHSALDDRLPSVSPTIFPAADQHERSDLYQASFFALYNHPSGFFARLEANWYKQDNDGYLADPLHPRNDSAPGDDFWQINFLAGWRFYKNQCELSCGVLNIADRNYELEPLNPYIELPRQRTFVVHCKFDF